MMNMLLMKNIMNHISATRMFLTILLCVLFMPNLQAATEASNQDLKILIPLYIYPSWWNASNYLWDDVADAQSKVDITAIINPNNGPNGGPPNSDYQQGLNDLRQAGVTILGYVTTSYGNRSLGEVKTDINLYDQFYDIDGVFLDEAANTKKLYRYYRKLYLHVKRKTSLDYVILNPGTTTHKKYFNSRRPAADTAVTFESPYSVLINSDEPPIWVDELALDHFALLTYDAIDEESMKTAIDLAVSRNYGYVFVTDDGLNNPWDTLPSYWSAMIDYIEHKNSSGSD